jgi:hypothetical protein
MIGAAKRWCEDPQREPTAAPDRMRPRTGVATVARASA